MESTTEENALFEERAFVLRGVGDEVLLLWREREDEMVVVLVWDDVEKARQCC